MNPKALPIARSRLRTARQALAGLAAAQSYEEFADHWFLFLTSWKGIYTVLEQGAKPSAQSRQWFGAKKAFRKGDDLLQYLFEARNDEEHGLAQSVVHNEYNGVVFYGGGGQTYRVEGDYDAGGEPRIIKIVDPAGNDVPIIRHTPRGPELMAVTARGGVKYDPPLSHLGQQIDGFPMTVATLALAYAEALVAEAAGLRAP